MKQKSQWILGCFLISVLIVGIFTGCSFGAGDSTNRTKKDYNNIEENRGIQIPGYDSLTLSADKKEQNMNLYNPEENTCYFRISLVLKSEEEVLWTSEYIEPGDELRSIRLNRPLKRGEYPAILQYECFSLKDERPLNGANVELALRVR